MLVLEHWAFFWIISPQNHTTTKARLDATSTNEPILAPAFWGVLRLEEECSGSKGMTWQSMHHTHSRPAWSIPAGKPTVMNDTVDWASTHACGHKILPALISITCTEKKSKAAWIILPNSSFVFTSKVLGPRVAGPRCCLEVKTSFIALQWAASHSMSERLASP